MKYRDCTYREKNDFLSYLFYSLGFWFPSLSGLYCLLKQSRYFFIFFFVSVFGWRSGNLHVLVRCRHTGVGGRCGQVCKGMCCVYSVQIIACFSAFSIEHHRKSKTKKKINFNTAIQLLKKVTKVCFLCCLE